MASEEEVWGGFLSELQAFLDLPANSAIECAWPNVAYTPTTGTAYVEPFLFIDPVQRAGIGSPGVRRSRGRFQINIHHALNIGPLPISQIAGRLMTYFEPSTKSPIVEGSTTVRIGDPYGQNSLPWTREPVTDDPWQTKPVIVPWWVDYLPS